jgi:hypothetical protein
MGRVLRASISSRRARGLFDSVFLAALVAAAALPYVRSLGFYADDWAFLGLLRTADDQSLAGLGERLYDTQPLQRARPTQIGYEAVLYRFFGLDPTGYHVVSLAVLMAMAALLYWVLREARLQRSLALSIAAVYALLPNYSSDRFWFAAFGYSLSMAMCFLSAYADLRAVRARGRRLVAWKTLAVAALAVAALGYEVVLPLLFVALILVWLTARRVYPGGLRARLGAAGAAAFVAVNVAALAVVIAYKASTAVGAGIPTSDVAFYLGQLVFGSLALNFGSYGVGLPATTWWGLEHASWFALAAAAAVGVSLFAYLRHVLRRGGEVPVDARTSVYLGVVGLGLFALGYAVFLTTDRIQFGSSTGVVNRTAIAAALGAAFVLTAAVAFFAAVLRPAWRATAFSATIAAICASSVVVVNAIAGYWDRAWTTEQRVLASIRGEFPSLPPRTTVILDGVCPYVGPGIVFESSWDLAGALQALYNDDSLRADVTADARVGASGIAAEIYGDETLYGYAPTLLVFDYDRRAATRLRDRDAARRYFGRYGEVETECPEGVAGEGTVRLLFDRAYKRLEARRFRGWN